MYYDQLQKIKKDYKRWLLITPIILVINIIFYIYPNYLINLLLDFGHLFIGFFVFWGVGTILLNWKNILGLEM